MNPYQLWALTNQGAVDFVTMKQLFPVVVKRLLELEAKMNTIESKTLTASVPGHLTTNRPQALRA